METAYMIVLGIVFILVLAIVFSVKIFFLTEHTSRKYDTSKDFISQTKISVQSSSFFVFFSRFFAFFVRCFVWIGRCFLKLSYSRYFYVIVIFFCALLVVFTAFKLAAYHKIPTNDYTELVASERVRDVFVEGALVPPKPIPPSVFLEVVSRHPALALANRDWYQLDPTFMQTALTLKARMQTRGYEIILLEGYRTRNRQEQLYNSPVLVTNAKPGESKHEVGKAADFAFYINGKILIDPDTPWVKSGYQILGEEAKKLGLTWGGDWKLLDLGHVEFSGK